MRRDEFVELHGEGIWESLIPVQQSPAYPYFTRCNANILTHAEIMTMLNTEGLPAAGLIDARRSFLLTHTEDDWEQLLKKHGLSNDSEHMSARQKRSWELTKSS